ncbi:MAG: type II and III secretion system protein, partial [Planctomycetes bacterium]|nr:type II and III secretion system protein [Planctomycetota bacterium]
KDNEMATFFKGDLVPFEAGSSVGGSSDRVTSNNTFDRVGMTLEIRPSMTPEDKVDMEVRVELSQLKDDIVNGQPVRGTMETDTKMIVDSGETIMLGGILFQKDSLVKRKVPLLGDIPLVGAIFRHQQETQINNELIIFIIPEVIGDDAGMADTVDRLMKKPLETLDNVKDTINRDFQKAGIVDPNEK